jgi:hypothetical protein
MYVNFLVNVIADYANDANILGRSVHTMKKNKEALLIASKQIGLEVKANDSFFRSNENLLLLKNFVQVTYPCHEMKSWSSQYAVKSEKERRK